MKKYKPNKMLKKLCHEELTFYIENYICLYQR